jgi:phage shock protein E
MDVWSVLPVIGIFLIAILLVGGLGGKADPHKVKVLVEESGARLLDVRTKDEFSSGHLDRALNIPVGDLERRLAELGDDKAKPVVVYCASGMRSGNAKRILVRAGFEDVHDLGSMSRWPD